MSREIAAAAVDGRVSCKALLELARRMDVEPGRVGRLCDEMKIHISNCQLGCFRRARQE